MSRLWIKICGVTTIADAQLAGQLGADAIGLNLYPESKRHVKPAVAREIAQALLPAVEPVVLFVNEPISSALAAAEPIARTIQWHGNDPPLPPEAPWRFIPAFPIADAASLWQVTSYLHRCRAAGRLPAAVLLDGHAPGQFGGTGQVAPWDLLAGFAPGVPVILAGGLTADNVADAVCQVRPYGVDVASGVESEPGRKDEEKLRRFIEACRP
jgi:phosphoribosylanthranilate isomerase